ncbi:MAG: NADH:flavin oxidoreductase [Peptococcaceae bacterium]|nr:NADH:flavin oxidoreductase [Peptococcaceae bacterium]
MTDNAKEHPFKSLLSPIKVGPVELKNRIALSPMNEIMSGENGEATEEMLAYFAARAKGGAGLIITGAIMGTKLASRYVWSRNLYCFKPGHLQGLHQLTERVHHFGAQIAAQMTIGFGRQGHSDDHHELAPAPTAGLPYEMYGDKMAPAIAAASRRSERPRLFMTGQNTREMTIEEIHSEQKEFAHSLQLAVIAGFDVIEIHAPHGYLEHQFLSPLTNRRTDMYGGSWHNRKRFLLEVAEQARYACGYDVAVGCRISAEEHMEGGLTREEMIEVAQDLEARGIDYINLSDGAGYTETGHLVPSDDRVDHWPETAADFKRALKIPVICASIHDPVLAESMVAGGKADIISLGRQLFCDPEWPNKVIENRPQDIVRCKRCDFCVMRCLAGIPPRCPQNPNLGREWAMEEYKIGPRKKGEPLMPRGIAGLPALDRPWWQKEVPFREKCPIPFRGPGSPGKV